MACINNENCYTKGGLVCIDGTCQCDQFEMYDTKIKKCLGLAGANCYVGTKGSARCIENSSCVNRIGNGKSASGRCSCNLRLRY